VKEVPTSLQSSLKICKITVDIAEERLYNEIKSRYWRMNVARESDESIGTEGASSENPRNQSLRLQVLQRDASLESAFEKPPTGNCSFLE
jgi:hypothetical protein